MISNPHTQLVNVNRCPQHTQNSTQHKKYEKKNILLIPTKKHNLIEKKEDFSYAINKRSTSGLCCKHHLIHTVMYLIVMGCE